MSKRAKITQKKFMVELNFPQQEQTLKTGYSYNMEFHTNYRNQLSDILRGQTNMSGKEFEELLKLWFMLTLAEKCGLKHIPMGEKCSLTIKATK